MSRMQRAKGARWERQVVELFRRPFPEAQRQGWRQVEEAVPDVRAGSFWIEAKVGAKTYPRRALLQAAASCPPGLTPIACCKDDRTQPTVTLFLDDFLDLVCEWLAGRGETSATRVAEVVKLADEVLGGGL